MKFLLLHLLLLCLTLQVAGQLSGRLLNDAGQPVSLANVLLLRSRDSSLVKAALTNENGNYTIECNTEGNYILRFSSIGYETLHSSVFEVTGTPLSRVFGTQLMKTSTQSLGEVIVRSQKPLYSQNPSGTVVNVEASLLTRGSSVLEVLERSPGVIIDHRNNDITLNGKSGVMVMLNGKLMRMPLSQVVTLLNGMSADDIATIELLTTPPSGYDAEGSAGLINIVLKKNRKRGINGTLSLTGGYGLGEKSTGSISLTNNTVKTGLYGSYTFSHNRNYSDIFITSSQDMPMLGGPMEVIFRNKTRQLQNNHDAVLGIDVKLDPKTTAGGSITYNNSSTSYNAFTNASYNVLPDSLLIFDGIIHGNYQWKNLINSIYLEKQLTGNSEINVAMDYAYYRNNNPTSIQSSFFDKNGDRAGSNNDTLFSPLQRGFANTTIQVGSGKIDFIKEIHKKIKLESGIKATYTDVTSLSGLQGLVNGEWEGRNETANAIDMHEFIGAAYASLNFEISPSLNLVAGARYENAHTQVRNARTKETQVDRKLGMFFPSLFLSKKLTDHSDLQFSFTRRISRPTYNDLASYVGYADPSAVFTGNSLLQPTVTNNLKFGYNYRGYFFSILLSRDIHPIARYQLTESPARDLLYVSPQNLSWQNNITLQANLPWKISNWWSMNYGLTGGLRQFKIEYTPEPVKKAYIGYSLNFSQSFTLPRSFFIELSGWYNSTGYSGSVKVDGFGAMNAGIKKELKNKGGVFQLAVTDFLTTMHIHSYFGAITKEAFSIANHVAYSAESGRFPITKLTYTRAFGSNKIKSHDKKAPGFKEESERIRKE
jgi:outer membrane receptor protein involved in Fe transport